ncbi:MAG: TonB-dependent receptor plug domain-containing protein [Methylococcales bacterium]|nr:TonB-dependent receptor plug domain-containing protein [Methylococcales bacterium]
MKKIVLLLGAGYLSSSLAAEPAKNTSPSKTPAKEEKNIQLEEMVVSDQGDKASTGTRLFPNTRLSTPSFKTTAQNVRTQVNAVTSEDTLRYAPGMFISRRYAGDTGGGLHIRGSSSTQSSHSMVYADGMPLHNPVRATFNGTPRWSMVSAGEIETSEVFYGPFSAEYSGNSFGGVINMTTKMPKKFEAQFDAMGLFQTPHRNGRNEPLLGFTTFASAGNRFDKFSIWGSYNHVENEGQPMTLNASGRTSPVLNTAAQRAAQARLPVVSGGENYQLPTAAPAVIYGDIGLAQAVTDLFKLKMGYDFTDDLQGRFTFAYENRKDDNSDPLSLLKNPDGTTNWGGATATGASANTTYFNSTFNQNIVVPGSVLGTRSLARNAYNYGLSLKGKVSDNWHIDTTASYYDARSKQVQSTLNPNHPQNKYLGQLSEDKPWWASYDLKLATDKFFGRNDLSFMGGYQFNHASLRLRTNNSNNYAAETASGLLNDNGGSTQTNALFSQMEWRFLPEWNVWLKHNKMI